MNGRPDLADLGDQLALFDLGPVAALPRPAGLREVDVGGVPCLYDAGDEQPARVFGWYYGYPACCVEAFVERAWAYIAGQRAESPPLHPVSGHILCPACAAGPMAPLPPRPAERYGFVHPPGLGDDDVPVLERPSLRNWRAG